MREVQRYLELAEQLLLRISAEEIDAEGTYVLDRHDGVFDARMTYTSRKFPVRTAGVELAHETLAVHFFIDRSPDLQILRADDYEIRDDGYAEELVREAVRLVAAFLRGEGSVEPRRNILGRRRAQLRLSVDGWERIAK